MRYSLHRHLTRVIHAVLVLALLAVAADLAHQMAKAAGFRIGQIEGSAASKNNGDTATPFTINKPRLSVDCGTASVTYRACLTSSCTAVATDEPIDPGDPYDIVMHGTPGFLAIYSTGAYTCQVYERVP